METLDPPEFLSCGTLRDHEGPSGGLAAFCGRPPATWQTAVQLFNGSGHRSPWDSPVLSAASCCHLDLLLPCIDACTSTRSCWQVWTLQSRRETANVFVTPDAEGLLVVYSMWAAVVCPQACICVLRACGSHKGVACSLGALLAKHHPVVS